MWDGDWLIALLPVVCFVIVQDWPTMYFLLLLLTCCCDSGIATQSPYLSALSSMLWLRCGDSFDVGVVSPLFEGQALLARHRMVRRALASHLLLLITSVQLLSSACVRLAVWHNYLASSSSSS